MPAPLVAVTPPDADRDAWLAERSSRVTASEIHEIAVGGRSTWRRLLADKLNGSQFQGNADTRRGHEREPMMLAYIAEFVAPEIRPNVQLFVHPDNDRIGATPDGIGELADGRVVAEVKSHPYDWDRETIPPDHYDQVQMQIAVTDACRGLYLWERMGPDGTPTLDEPRYVWVPRDDLRIDWLMRQAREFLAWWDAGAPGDDLAPDLDDALARWADARMRKRAAEADEDAAGKIIRSHIAKTPGALTDGLRLTGRAAGFVYTVTEAEELDQQVWSERNPRTYNKWLALRRDVDARAQAATRRYHTVARSTRLTIREKKA